MLGCGLLAVHVVLAYAQLCTAETLEFRTVNVVAWLVPEAAKRGAWKQDWLGIHWLRV